MNMDTSRRNWFAVRSAGLAAAAVLLAGLLAGCEQLARLPRLLGGGPDYLLHGYDIICYPGQSVELTARLQRGNDLEDVAGAQIIFTRDELEIGRACTDCEGYARLRWTVPAEPGCWFVRCQPAEPGIAADAGSARLLITARPPDTPLVVVDMDNTIVHRQWGIITGSASPMPDAAETLCRVADACDCQIVYLSARPDVLDIRSRDWLDKNGFPLGPLLLSQRALLISARSQRDYKTQKLTELKSRFRNIRVGVGDRPSDVQAYRTADVPLSIVILHPENGDYRNGELRGLAGRNCQVRIVDNWRDVEGVMLKDLSLRPTR